jgi:hypothetical protein
MKTRLARPPTKPRGDPKIIKCDWCGLDVFAVNAYTHARTLKRGHKICVIKEEPMFGKRKETT